MSPTRNAGSPRRRAVPKVVARLAIGGLVLATATGCSSEDWPRLGMPAPITEQGKRVLGLWQGGWAAAFFVGALVWGLIIWCVIAYRRRGDAIAPQLTYNLPIEFLYTAVPIVFVAIFFFFTARDETYLDKLTPNPDVTVEVVGFQWDWQFNYLESPANGAKTLAQVTGDNAHGLPATLVLPAGQTVRFKLVSPDVDHSFWIPSFLFKRDVIPGRTNQFEVRIQSGKEGTYIGRCAELCGLNHDRMIFYLKVVSPDDYQSYLANQEAKYAGRSS